MILLLLFLLVLTAPASAAQAVRPADFAHRYELTATAGEGAVYRLALPRSVYEGLAQSQRRDLAVYNGKSAVVPFAVREAAPAHRDFELPERRVPLYELPEPKADAAEPLDVYVETGAGGQIVSVKGGGGGGARTRRYLLDFSGFTEGGEAIRRELRLTLPEAKLSARLSAFGSANLRDWRPLLEDAPLMRLENEGERLLSDRVELPRAPGRYVLLRIEDAGPAFELKGVGYAVTERRASLRVEEAEIEGRFAEKAPAGVGSAGGDPITAVEYDARGAFPLSAVNFVLREPGFYRARYLSRPDAQAAWRTRGRMELSMMRDREGAMRTNAPARVSACEDRYWRLEIEGSFSGEPPEMRIVWRPGEVFFLAQGGGPYLLAFGSAVPLPPLEDDAFLTAAALGAALSVDLAPAEGNAAAPDAPNAGPGREAAGWQRHLVWALLILSGLLLSGMAWRLLKGGK